MHPAVCCTINKQTKKQTNDHRTQQRFIKYEYGFIFRHREVNCRQMTLLEMKSHFQQCNLYIPFKMF